MRLTASHQSYDITRLNNSRHTKPIPDLQNNYFPPLLCYCKPTSTNTEKCWSAGPYRAPCGGAAETTHKQARPSPLPEPTTLNLGTCKFPTLLNKTTNNLLPRIMLPTETYRLTEASRAWRPDGRMQLRENRRETAQPQLRDAPQPLAYSHPLPERTTRNTTCLYIMCLDLATEQLPQNVSPTADKKKPHGTSHTGDLGDKRTQAARRPYALPQPQFDRRRTHSSAITPA